MVATEIELPRAGMGLARGDTLSSSIRLACGIFVASMLVLRWGHAAWTQPLTGFDLPPGFEITEYAGPDLADDIYTLTFDTQGRVCVSGKGYIKALVDHDDDGAADEAKIFLEAPEDGAMGLLWVGPVLYYTGDGGLWRVTDRDGDLRPDAPPAKIHDFKTGDEHGVHAIRSDSEGRLYVLGGNHMEFSFDGKEHDHSPIREQIGGALVRFSANLQSCEIIADGFRNPYDFAFNSEGEIFTFDSDNERDVILPFYEPTRVYHVPLGGHQGWQNPQRAHLFRFPPYFRDCVPPIATLGRGSPCGVEIYNHSQFPEKYRDNLFVLDWTFGNVWFLDLTPSGSTYKAAPELFLSPTGTDGFAPTDLAIHPHTGELYVSIGGRGTRGAVYRIRYTGQEEGSNETRSSASNRRVPTASVVSPLRHPIPGTIDEDRVSPLIENIELTLENLIRTASSEDRFTRARTSDSIRILCTQGVPLTPGKGLSPLAAMTWAWGIRDASPDIAANEALDVLLEDSETIPKLEATRLLQILSGGLMSEESQRTIWEGYSRKGESRLSPEVQSRLWKLLPDLYPTGHPDLDRELSRLFCEVELENLEVAERVIAGITPESHPTEDIHRLLVLGGLRPPTEFVATEKLAHALLSLDWKIDNLGLSPEHQWPNRMAELYQGLSSRYPELGSAMLADASFGHPRHVNFTQPEGFEKSRAARLFLEIADKNPDFEWSYATVRLMESIPPEEGYPTLRKLWDRRLLRLPLLIVLSGRPQLEDLDKFLWGLQPNRPDLVTRGLEGLEKTEPTAAPETLAPLAVIADSNRLREENADLMARADRLLLRLTGLGSPPAEGWSSWFMTNFPDRAGLLAPKAVSFTQDWETRLAGVDWSTGDPVRGRAVAEELACVACHQSSRGLGPDLRGVTSRFAREDLFATILDPSRDISSQYRATLIETVEGDFHQGFIVYEAVDGVLLQEGPEMMTRLVGEEILEMRESEVSMMPAGLLDQSTDGEIADLWAYLETLQVRSE